MQDQNLSHNPKELLKITCGLMGPGETNNNYNNPYSHVSLSSVSRYVKSNLSVSLASQFSKQAA